MVSHQPFKENEKCSIPSVLWKDSIGNVMLIEHLKCLYRIQHSKSQTDLKTSSDCKHLLYISAGYWVVLCILVFSSCRFWFIFRIHPSKRNVLSLCMHSGYIQILLGSFYFMSCVFGALWPDVGVTDESRVKENPNTLLLYWWDNYRICLPCNGTWNWQFLKKPFYRVVRGLLIGWFGFGLGLFPFVAYWSKSRNIQAGFRSPHPSHLS